MATYYVRDTAATIQKQDERLLVIKDKQQIGEIPLHQLDQLVVMGEVQVTTQAFALLMRAQVDVVFMTRGGNIIGRVVANESRFAELRLRQLQAMSDAATNLRLAKQIVAGKLQNQLLVLDLARQPTRALAGTELIRGQLPSPEQPPRGSAAVPTAIAIVPKPPAGKPKSRLPSFGRRRDAPADAPPNLGMGPGLIPPTQSQRLQRATQQRPYGTALSGLHEMLVGAANAGDADSLRGYEGKAAAWYWPAFKLVLDNPMGFDKRIYFPSPDPINALLSFGYALLQKDITAAVQLVGLDPYLGFFHTVQYGRPSLALDLMEEFRPVIVDRLVLRLVNWGAIRERDFVAGPGDRATPEREPLRPLAGRPPTRAQSRPISLTDAAVKRVIQAYEEVVNTPVLHPRLNERTPFRRCMTVQVQQLARVLKGEEPDYEPFVAKLAAS